MSREGGENLTELIRMQGFVSTTVSSISNQTNARVD